MTPETVTFKDKVSGNTLTVSLPVDVMAMRRDANWVEVLPNGEILDRYKEQREPWDIPVEMSHSSPGQQTPAKRGRPRKGA